MYNGIIPALLIYPMKYLNTPLLPHDSLISTLSVLVGLLLL